MQSAAVATSPGGCVCGIGGLIGLHRSVLLVCLAGNPPPATRRPARRSVLVSLRPQPRTGGWSTDCPVPRSVLTCGVPGHRWTALRNMGVSNRFYRCLTARSDVIFHSKSWGLRSAYRTILWPGGVLSVSGAVGRPPASSARGPTASYQTTDRRYATSVW